MRELLLAIADICVLRRGPQDLPASAFLLSLTLAFHAASGLLLALAYHGPLQAAAVSLVDTTVLAGLTVGLLYLRSQTPRVLQSLSALAGTGGLLGLAALVPTWWWHIARDAAGESTAAALWLLALVVWGLVIMAHVLRHALSAPFAVGLAVALGFYWVAIAVQESLFPLPD